MKKVKTEFKILFYSATFKDEVYNGNIVIFK